MVLGPLVFSTFWALGVPILDPLAIFTNSAPAYRMPIFIERSAAYPAPLAIKNAYFCRGKSCVPLFLCSENPPALQKTTPGTREPDKENPGPPPLPGKNAPQEAPRSLEGQRKPQECPNNPKDSPRPDPGPPVIPRGAAGTTPQATRKENFGQR